MVRESTGSRRDLDPQSRKMIVIASLATSEQAQLAKAFSDAGSPPLKDRKISYNNIEPDFTGTDLERRALFNGLKRYDSEVDESTSIVRLREIRDKLLG